MGGLGSSVMGAVEGVVENNLFLAPIYRSVIRNPSTITGGGLYGIHPNLNGDPLDFGEANLKALASEQAGTLETTKQNMLDDIHVLFTQKKDAIESNQRYRRINKIGAIVLTIPILQTLLTGGLGLNPIFSIQLLVGGAITGLALERLIKGRRNRADERFTAEYSELRRQIMGVNLIK